MAGKMLCDCGFLADPYNSVYVLYEDGIFSCHFVVHCFLIETTSEYIRLGIQRTLFRSDANIPFSRLPDIERCFDLQRTTVSLRWLVLREVCRSFRQTGRLGRRLGWPR